MSMQSDGSIQRAYHARREWAAVCMQRCASHWLYKPPNGPMFRKGMQSLVGKGSRGRKNASSLLRREREKN